MAEATGDDYAARIGWIRNQEVGRGTRIDTPYGPRLICYADVTATGRHLRFVERAIRRIRPMYANTHTEISSTGLLMTHLREDARRTIHAAVGAGSDDVVVFVGAGATAAVNKLVGLLGLAVSEPIERRFDLSGKLPPDERPVVFVGPYEHHSNELPWLESIAEVVEIGLDRHEQVDLSELEARLREHADRPLKVGSFSAASNVTGVLSDVHAIAGILHRGGAFACFDYAAAGPYVPISMTSAHPEEHLDAIFLSTHKFVGGPESSGLLVANRALFRSPRPERPGGGTVDYVAGPRRDDVDYVSSLADREEGGTPAIIGDIRAGMAFAIKERVGPERIRAHEVELAEQATERLSRHPNIRVLGPRLADRLAIVPIMVEGLHHDLFSALLDHLFGIQNRSGCSCAGPYGHRLLGIGPERSARFRELVSRGIQGIKPGWVRVSLPFYASEADLEFILSAVEFVATHAMEFVPLYRLGWGDGAWRPVEGPDPNRPEARPGIDGLLDRSDNERGEAGVDPPIDEDELRVERARYFAESERTAARLRERWVAKPPKWNPPTGDPELDELIWFRWVHAGSPGEGG